MEKIKLSKSISYGGEEYQELNLDLDNLSGADIIAVEQECLAMQQAVSPVVEFSKTYLAGLAARAAKVDSDMIRALPLKDFTYITLVVQNFLLDSETQEEKTLGELSSGSHDTQGQE